MRGMLSYTTPEHTQLITRKPKREMDAMLRSLCMYCRYVVPGSDCEPTTSMMITGITATSRAIPMLQVRHLTELFQQMPMRRRAARRYRGTSLSVAYSGPDRVSSMMG